MKTLRKGFCHFRSVTLAAFSIVLLAGSVLPQLATAAKVTVPKLPQEKLLKQCEIPIDHDFDPLSLATLYDSGQISTADMQQLIMEKLTQWSTIWGQVQNNPYLKYQAEVSAARCMSDIVRSLDQVVVKEWQALEKQGDKTTAKYISDLTTQDVQAQLTRLHQILVDRNMPELAPNGAPLTPQMIDSFDEKYQKLAADAQAKIDNRDTASPDMFPFLFAATNADFLNGITLDYGWQLNAATAYLGLPAYDTLLQDTQFLGQAIRNHFYNEKNGDLINKEKYFFAADVNVSYAVSTLNYVSNLVGDAVDYSKVAGQSVNAELGGARYDRANAILYTRYIVRYQPAYRVKTYEEIERAANDLYKRINTLKDKKTIIESTYFVMALQTLMTPYMADGQLTAQEVTQLVSDSQAFFQVIRTKNIAALADYYNTLFAYEITDDEYITPLKLASQTAEVMKQLFGEDVAKIMTEAAKDGKINAEEREAIQNAIMTTAKGNALILKNTKLYMKSLQSVMLGVYENQPNADLGNYNLVLYKGLDVNFPDGDLRPSYAPAHAKFEVPPMGALRKGALDTVAALRTMLPIAREQTEDAKVITALKKIEDMKNLIPLLAGATEEYVKENQDVLQEEGLNAFVNGLITAWYQTAAGYKTPALSVLYEVKVNGKSLNEVLKAMIPTNIPVDSDRVMNVLNTLADVLITKAFSTGSSTEFER